MKDNYSLNEAIVILKEMLNLDYPGWKTVTFSISYTTALGIFKIIAHPDGDPANIVHFSYYPGHVEYFNETAKVMSIDEYRRIKREIRDENR